MICELVELEVVIERSSGDVLAPEAGRGGGHIAATSLRGKSEKGAFWGNWWFLDKRPRTTARPEAGGI